MSIQTKTQATTNEEISYFLLISALLLSTLLIIGCGNSSSSDSNRQQANPEKITPPLDSQTAPLQSYIPINFDHPSNGNQIIGSDQCVILDNINAKGDVNINYYSPTEELGKQLNLLSKIAERLGIPLETSEKDSANLGYSLTRNKDRGQESYKKLLYQEVSQLLESINEIHNDLIQKIDSTKDPNIFGRVKDIYFTSNNILDSYKCFAEEIEIVTYRDLNGAAQLGFEKKELERRGYVLIADEFNEGLAKVCRSNKCGFINRYGEEVIPLKFDKADIFREGLAPVANNNRWFFVDYKGNPFGAKNYNKVYPFYKGATFAQYNLLDPFFLIEFDEKGNFSKKYDIYKGDYKYYQYNYATAFDSEGIAIVTKSESKGLVDYEGKELVTPQYLDIKPQSEGFFSAQSRDNKKWGFIKKNNDVVVSFLYNEVNPFLNGFAIVKGEANVLPDMGWLPNFKNAESEKRKKQLMEKILFIEAATNVKGAYFGLINKNGLELFPPILKEVTRISANSFYVDSGIIYPIDGEEMRVEGIYSFNSETGQCLNSDEECRNYYAFVEKSQKLLKSISQYLKE